MKLNSKGKIGLFIVAALVCVVAGFVIGQVGHALQALPGDTNDPVATQSYVETAMGEKMAALSTRIDELEAEVVALKGGTPTSGTTGSTTGGTTSGSTDKKDDTTTTASGKLEITGNSVNVRATASTSADKVTSLSKGTKVTLVATEGDWYKIKTSDGKVGYVASYLAKKVQ